MVQVRRRVISYPIRVMIISRWFRVDLSGNGSRGSFNPYPRSRLRRLKDRLTVG
jgi:hypothetical protein